MGIIETLTKAVMNKFNSATGLNLRSVCTGGLYFQRAPDDVDVPYAVFYWLGTDIDDMMGGQTERIEKVSLQFNIFASDTDGGITAMNISEEFQNLYDWCDLDYPQGCDYRHIAFQRTAILPLTTYDKYVQIGLTYTAWVDH